MQTVIIVIHLMVVVAMVGLVLLQKSEGGGLGMGGGAGFMTNRGTANVLTRTTAILAGVFFLTSLVLSVLAGFDRKPHSIIQTNAPTNQQAPAPPSGGNLLDQLKPGGQGEPTPAPTPAPPTPPPGGPAPPQSQ
jgi:preprotein translocase subunit SecG